MRGAIRPLSEINQQATAILARAVAAAWRKVFNMVSSDLSLSCENYWPKQK